ncbi:MAG: hypothetical protein ACJ8F3_12195 [Xanthobacteraceae bacterium]
MAGKSVAIEIDGGRMAGCQVVERLQLYENHDGSAFAFELYTASGKVVGPFHFSADAYDVLIDALRGSQEKCAESRSAARN